MSAFIDKNCSMNCTHIFIHFCPSLLHLHKYNQYSSWWNFYFLYTIVSVTQLFKRSQADCAQRVLLLLYSFLLYSCTLTAFHQASSDDLIYLT